MIKILIHENDKIKSNKLAKALSIGSYKTIISNTQDISSIIQKQKINLIVINIKNADLIPKNVPCFFMVESLKQISKFIPINLINYDFIVYPFKQQELLLRINLFLEKNKLSNTKKTHQLEKNFAESEKRFRDISENSMEWIWEVDKNDNYIYTNSMVEKILGFKPNEILNKNFYDLFHPDDREEIKSALFEIFSQKKSFQEFINRTIDKNGDTVWLLTSGVPVLDKKGNLKGYRGSDANITELINIEKRLTLATNELEKRVQERTSELTSANEELQQEIIERKRLETQLIQAQKMETLGILAGGLAHDFNNILSTVIGYSYILLKKITDAEQKQFVEKILSAANKASDLITNLLNFGKKQITKYQNLKLNNIIIGIKKLFSGIINKNIKISTFLTDKDLLIFADAGQIEQVLINLITNAQHAMPNGGELTIKTEGECIIANENLLKSFKEVKTGEYVILSVSDNGIGMNEETQKRIFEPFFTTKSSGKGTGLGLLMVNEIVKKHNGFIEVFSELGKGTTFKIYLPIVKGQE